MHLTFLFEISIVPLRGSGGRGVNFPVRVDCNSVVAVAAEYSRTAAIPIVTGEKIMRLHNNILLYLCLRIPDLPIWNYVRMILCYLKSRFQYSEHRIGWYKRRVCVCLKSFYSYRQPIYNTVSSRHRPYFPRRTDKKWFASIIISDCVRFLPRYNHVTPVNIILLYLWTFLSDYHKYRNRWNDDV